MLRTLYNSGSICRRISSASAMCPEFELYQGALWQEAGSVQTVGSVKVVVACGKPTAYNQQPQVIAHWPLLTTYYLLLTTYFQY